MFDFSNADLTHSNFKDNIKPGIHVVTITSITNGASSLKQVPYLEFTFEDVNGAQAKHKFYISTTVGEGKKASAWDITQRAILNICVAVFDLELQGMTLDQIKEKAKSKLPKADSVENLTSKLSTILIGKTLRVKFNGEEKISQKGTKFIAAVLAGGYFCESSKVKEVESKLKFNENSDIKKLNLPENLPSSPNNDLSDIVF